MNRPSVFSNNIWCWPWEFTCSAIADFSVWSVCNNSCVLQLNTYIYSPFCGTAWAQFPPVGKSECMESFCHVDSKKLILYLQYDQHHNGWITDKPLFRNSLSALVHDLIEFIYQLFPLNAFQLLFFQILDHTPYVIL